MSEAINELAAALSVAQGMFTNPERNRTVSVNTKAGDRYSFSYSTLDTIMDMVRPALAANGLAITHMLSLAADGWVCVTKLLHASGQSIECPIPVLVSGDGNAQKWGSAITYAKRYGVCTLLAITADEDDDANIASENQAERLPARKAAPKASGKPVSKEGFGAPPAHTPTEPVFSWNTATSAQRRDKILGRISEAVGATKSEEGVAKLKIVASGLDNCAKDFDAEDMQKIREWLEQAEKQIKARGA